MTTPRRTRWTPVVVSLVALMFATACGLQFSLSAEARDQWKKTYTLAPGGSFEIHNTNGRIEIRTGEGDAVEVVADRIVRAATDEGARDALRNFEIAETVAPDHILLDSTNHGMNLQLNISKHVDFVVLLPKTAAVKLVSTNGEVDAADVEGPFTVETTNGRVKATGLASAATVSSTNGAINLDFTKLGQAGIACDTTNGAIQVTIPRDTKATISARVTNGSISIKDLELAATEQSRKRLDASIGGGGPPIRLATINGLVELRGR